MLKRVRINSVSLIFSPRRVENNYKHSKKCCMHRNGLLFIAFWATLSWRPARQPRDPGRDRLSLGDDLWSVCKCGREYYWKMTPVRVGVHQHTRYSIKWLNEFTLMLMTYFYRETTVTNNSIDDDSMQLIRIPNNITNWTSTSYPLFLLLWLS